MLTIEKAVRIVSDLYDFYRNIPRVSSQRPMGDKGEKDRQAPQRKERDGTLESSRNLLASHR